MRPFLILAALFIGLLPPTATTAQSNLLVSSLTWSPDGMLFAVGTSEGVKVYSAETAEMLWQSSTEQPVNVVQFSPSGTSLAAGLGSGTGLDQGFVQVWAADTGEQITYFEANRFAVYVLDFSPDGQRLVSGGGYFPTRGGGDYRIRSWDTTTWEAIPEAENSGISIVTAIAFSTDDQYMVYSNARSSVNLITADTNELTASIHQEGAECIVFDTEASKLVLGFYRSVQVWELRSQPEIHLVRQTIWNTSYSENIEEFLLGEYVIGCELDRFATSSEDGTLRVRDVETSDVEFTYHEEGRRFTEASFNPDGTRLAFISDTGTSPISGSYQADYRVAIWTLNSAEPVYIDLD
jgi:WD40 repeat protein